MAANGRYFYEGIPLGNRPPISAHPQAVRQTKGPHAPSAALESGPIIASYGLNTKVTVTGQHKGADGDFMNFTYDLHAMQAGLFGVTRQIENRAVLEHNVASRKLGILSYVDDVDWYAEVTSAVVATGTVGFGTIRVNLGTEYFPTGEVFEVGDVAILTEDAEVPAAGEAGVVTDTDLANGWVEFVSRNVTETGDTTIYDGLTMKLFRAEMWHPEMVFRGVTWASPKNLSDAGDVPQGARFEFEGSLSIGRRGQVVVQAGTPWGDGYGNDPYGV